MEKRPATERVARRETNGEKKMSEETECWCWRIRARCLADSVTVSSICSPISVNQWCNFMPCGDLDSTEVLEEL